MTRRAILALNICILASSWLEAAVKPGLAGAQELFRQNRWAEARAHLKASPPSSAEGGKAAFLVGRSYGREAEFYRAARLLSDQIGIVYLKELGAQKENRALIWIPLFSALYQLDQGDDAVAARALAALETRPLTPPWRTVARRRASVAQARGSGRTVSGLAASDQSPEACFWRQLFGERVTPPPASAAAGRTDKLAFACCLFPLGRQTEAETLLKGVNLELPDVEEAKDPKKVLRFFDPLALAAWERILWEQALGVLRPLAASGSGAEKALAEHYSGVALFMLGSPREALPLLEESSRTAPDPELVVTARVLAAAAAWPKTPPAAQLLTLWNETQGVPEAVLTWETLRRPEWNRLEPFATKLEARSRDLLSSSSPRLGGATAGRWGLARLRRGAEVEGVLTQLSSVRDHANKNKLEWNDPLLLLALSAANAEKQEYAQALETLFELAKTLPGLRGLQWNLQGVYAARQKAGGETRISH